MQANTPRAFTLLLAATLTCGAALAGCKPTPRTTMPTELTAEQAALFEQGVDFIAKLEGLEGRWREDWERDLQQRVQWADLVAVVTVRTLRTDTDPERRVTHHVVAQVDRVIHGEVPGSEIELSVREGAPGFVSVDQAAARLPQQTLVAYVKWVLGQTGEPVPYFHLSPASDEVVAATEGWVAHMREPEAAGGRVIVHTH